MSKREYAGPKVTLVAGKIWMTARYYDMHMWPADIPELIRRLQKFAPKPKRRKAKKAGRK